MLDPGKRPFLKPIILASRVWLKTSAKCQPPYFPFGAQMQMGDKSNHSPRKLSSWTISMMMKVSFVGRKCKYVLRHMKLNFAVKQQIKLKVIKGSSNVCKRVHEHNTYISNWYRRSLKRENMPPISIYKPTCINVNSKNKKVRTKKAHVKMASVLKWKFVRFEKGKLCSGASNMHFVFCPHTTTPFWFAMEMAWRSWWCSQMLL